MSGVAGVSGAVCRNHPNVCAIGRCTGCAEPLCQNCLVQIGGQNYCGHCKVMTLSGQTAIEGLMMPCKEANEALTFAIVAVACSVFCLGTIFGPIAIAKAAKAKQLINSNPYLLGSGKATAAMIIGIVAFLFSVLVIIEGQLHRR